jgi:hypothetical protein
MPRIHVSESDVLPSILAYLNAKRIFAYRTNSGAMKRGERYIKFNGVKGCADITGVLPMPCGCGVALFIETKSSTGRQTKEQKDFQSEVERDHAIYILARSIDDVERGIRAYRERRRTKDGR